MSSKPKALILCNDFPPINSIGAERPNSWYLYFNELGIHPVVITKNWNSTGNSSFNQIHNHCKRENTDYGTLIKTPRRNTPSIWFKSKNLKRFGFIGKGLTFIEKIISFKSGFIDQHYGIYLEAKRFIEKNNVSVVITTGEPFILFRYGRKLQKKFGIKWIADYRDGWYLNHNTVLDSSILIKGMRKWELLQEKTLCIHADMITTIDPQMARRLNQLLKRNVEYIYNGFWEYYEPLKLDKNQNKTIINHTGTLTSGQRIELLLDVLLTLYRDNKLNKDNFEFNLIGLEYFPLQMKRLENYRELIDEIIFTTPRLPKNDAVSMNLKADYLISFTDPNLSAIYAKTYDYVACQKPIVVIPGDMGLLDDLVIQNNLGQVLNTEDDILNFISNPKVTYTPKKEDTSFFKRKNQAKILVKKIEKLISKN